MMKWWCKQNERMKGDHSYRLLNIIWQQEKQYVVNKNSRVAYI